MIDLRNKEILAAPVTSFFIGDSEYAIALLLSGDVTPQMHLMVKEGDLYSVVAIGKSVQQNYVDHYGGFAGFVQHEFNKWNAILKERHTSAGEVIEVDNLFTQLGKFIQDNLVVTDNQIGLKS